MRWKIQRRGGAGPHVIGPEVVQFDAEGMAWTTNPAVADKAAMFPGGFLVLAMEDEAPVTASPDETGPDTEAAPPEQGEGPSLDSAPDGAQEGHEPPSPVGPSVEAETHAAPEASGTPDAQQNTPQRHTEASLKALTVPELRKMAQELGIQQVARMKEADLVAAILAQDDTEDA